MDELINGFLGDESATPTSQVFDYEAAIHRYIELRDQKADMKATFEESVKPVDAEMKAIEGSVLAALEANKSETSSTKSGMCYKSLFTSVTVSDKTAFMDYVKSHNAFELLDIKANKTAVEDFISEHNDVPPGANVTRFMKVNFRRA